ncbi:glycosyltransferase family 4 protein [Streptomyces sp. NPDC057654]|uniref:glycosyltransferase family 4 protein n=1 Tax=Streptomyces sp. NPDC057654 TaxID=3346196 RepID=UPI00368EB860
MNPPDPHLSGIIVVNERYFPDDEQVPAHVGATSFARSVLRCLQRADLSAGAILYKRDEELDEPWVHLERRSGVLCAILRFHFDMRDSAVAAAIAEAAHRLLAEQDIDGPAMLYYQTDALLGFHPEEFACCVTHHGPFVYDFIGSFPAVATGWAFGDADKALHLLKYQELGLDKVRASDRMFVLQHSHLQRRHLVSRGVDERRILAVRPPIPLLDTTEFLADGELRDFVDDAELLVFTAVARLDYFKNIELLVDAGIRARSRGIPVRILVVGDDRDDGAARERLRARVPAEHRADFLAAGRLSKPQLHALFRRVKTNGVFVCPSRYETLGITPLEAALSGVCTLMTDADTVEARRFFPADHRFAPTRDGLADAIERMYTSHLGIEQLGKELQGSISAEVSEENFERDALSAWGHFSRAARRLTVRPVADPVP